MGRSQLTDRTEGLICAVIQEINLFPVIGLLCHSPDMRKSRWFEWNLLQQVSPCKSCDNTLSLEIVHGRCVFSKCIIQKSVRGFSLTPFNSFCYLKSTRNLWLEVLGDDERSFLHQSAIGVRVPAVTPEWFCFSYSQDRFGGQDKAY